MLHVELISIALDLMKTAWATATILAIISSNAAAQTYMLPMRDGVKVRLQNEVALHWFLHSSLQLNRICFAAAHRRGPAPEQG